MLNSVAIKRTIRRVGRWANARLRRYACWTTLWRRGEGCTPSSAPNQSDHEGIIMADQALPSADMLRQLLTYEPETGRLFWKERSESMFRDTDGRSAHHACANWNARYAGAEAFTSANSRGCRQGAISNRLFLAHRLIWCLVTGEWPIGEIDHRDHDPGNNRWVNLREATRSQNTQNTTSHAGSSSKFLGVGWCKQTQRWRAKISVLGRAISLGRHQEEEAAARAYDRAALRHFGPFANLNFK